MSGSGSAVDARREAVAAGTWTVLRQAHGGRVVVAERPGGATGEEADAVVSATPGTVLAVLTADCAPIVLSSPEGVFGVVHAGWRGLCGGVVGAAVVALRRLGAGEVEAALGPCIRPCCYAFGPEDLAMVAGRCGPEVIGRDRTGAPALDLPAGVLAALRASGARLGSVAGTCTGCSGGYWSWRARGDRQRQVTVAWRP